MIYNIEIVDQFSEPDHIEQVMVTVQFTLFAISWQIDVPHEKWMKVRSDNSGQQHLLKQELITIIESVEIDV